MRTTAGRKTGKRVLTTLALMAGLVLAGVAPAAAEKVRPQPVDSRDFDAPFAPDHKGEWRVVTLTGGTSTCIGDPVTPLCVVETYLACYLRAMVELCRTAMARFWRQPSRVHWRANERYYLIYRLAAAAPVTAESMRRGLIELPRQPGDIRMWVEKRRCWTGTPIDDCLLSDRDTGYILRRSGRRWGAGGDDDRAGMDGAGGRPIRVCRSNDFAPDPEWAWRTIDGYRSTSTCIEEPVTPLCAVETYLACHARGAFALCPIAVEPSVWEPIDADFTLRTAGYLDYRVVWVRRLTTADLRQAGGPPRRTGALAMGDLLIGIIKRRCVGGPHGWCEPEYSPATYALRRSGGRWAIVAGVIGPEWHEPYLVDSRRQTGVFAPDPEWAWRTMTQTDGTSGCIGEPVTPLCAIETSIACILRENPELCRIAWAVDPRLSLVRVIEGASVIEYIDYRVVSVRRLTAGHAPAKAGLKLWGRPGDLVIGIVRRWCHEERPIEHCQTTEDPPTTYIMHRLERRWVVFRSYVPR